MFACGCAAAQSLLHVPHLLTLLDSRKSSSTKPSQSWSYAGLVRSAGAATLQVSSTAPVSPTQVWWPPTQRAVPLVHVPLAAVGMSITEPFARVLHAAPIHDSAAPSSS